MPAKKVNDRDIITLNSVGISLSGIGKRLDCHHTTVKGRLKVLNIDPADTRRSFMEDIYDGLSPNQREWLAGKLGPSTSIKDFVEGLIVNKYVEEKNP
jgi:hypothetical protein